MLGPRIDERYVLARLHHMRAGIPANCTRSHDRYLLAHCFLPLNFRYGLLLRRIFFSRRLSLGRSPGFIAILASAAQEVIAPDSYFRAGWVQVESRGPKSRAQVTLCG